MRTLALLLVAAAALAGGTRLASDAFAASPATGTALDGALRSGGAGRHTITAPSTFAMGLVTLSLFALARRRRSADA